jgi:hypothetical protein
LVSDDDGRRLLHQWEPPTDSGRALGCIATTFTFDADFFEQQCAGRFLALDTRPENELAFLIEREEQLAETPIAVIADRRLNPDSRSLRWDVLTARAPTGVMHAKLTILVWERAVRVLVCSANLTERSYRSSIEVAVALDAVPGSDVPRAVFDAGLREMRRIIRLAPGDETTEGPKARALDTVRRAISVLDDLGLPTAPRRGAAQLRVTATGRGDDVLGQLSEAWSGPAATRATVMSPFFDAGETASRAAARLVDLLAKRNARVDIVVPVDQLEARSVARVPAALLSALPGRLQPRIFDVHQPDPEEVRTLHAKVVLLESPSWVAALVGSSNFTRAGLGIGGGGNVEVGLAIGARADSDVAAALRLLVLPGDEVTGTVDLEPCEDSEEQAVPVPAAFVSALADPGPPPVLFLHLQPSVLPSWWEITTLDGAVLASSERYEPGVATIERRVEEPPFVVAIAWEDADGMRQQGKLPVNVTDPAALPPPAELRMLPIEALLRALGSTRPLHEGLADEIGRIVRADAAPGGADAELDALKRFSPSGLLLQRTKELSYALAGMRERLSRPAASLDAFRWRLTGPFGPRAIAEGLVRQADERGSLDGEASFLLAEIALTLGDVDLDAACRHLDGQHDDAQSVLRDAVAALAELREGRTEEPSIADYADAAFAKAS